MGTGSAGKKKGWQFKKKVGGEEIRLEKALKRKWAKIAKSRERVILLLFTRM